MSAMTEKKAAETAPLIWIDTDTGVDDAAALAAAVSLEQKGLLKIAGVSSVCGNAEEKYTFRNARNVLSYLGRADIPVYSGASRPLIEKLFTAAHVHGKEGLGEAHLPESEAKVQTRKAWDALYETAKAFDGSMELVLIGPQTNAAIAFQKYPDLGKYLKRILIMGGAEVGGNITPAAEFNIYVDPHAAQIVFKSGVPIVMCGLDVTMRSILTDEDLKCVNEGTSNGCRLFQMTSVTSSAWYRSIGVNGVVAHDVCPVLYSVWPEMFSGEEAGVFVETRGRITRGKTVSDRITDVKFGRKNTRILLDVDKKRFVEVFTGLLLDI